jgi:hypothetical protein
MPSVRVDRIFVLFVSFVVVMLRFEYHRIELNFTTKINRRRVKSQWDMAFRITVRLTDKIPQPL